MIYISHYLAGDLLGRFISCIPMYPAKVLHRQKQPTWQLHIYTGIKLLNMISSQVHKWMLREIMLRYIIMVNIIGQHLLIKHISIFVYMMTDPDKHRLTDFCFLDEIDFFFFPVPSALQVAGDSCGSCQSLSGQRKLPWAVLFHREAPEVLSDRSYSWGEISTKGWAILT